MISQIKSDDVTIKEAYFQPLLQKRQQRLKPFIC